MKRKPWNWTKDPARFHAHRRLKGPMRLATGPNSYAAHDARMRAELEQRA